MTTETETAVQYRFLDADTHFYETRDCYTRHMEPRFRDKAVHVAPDADGKEHLWAGDTIITDFFPMMELFFGQDDKLQIVPGALLDKLNPFRDLTREERKERYEHYRRMAPAFTQRADRLKLMDQQGMDAALLFPSAGLLVEEALKTDVEATYANLRALNRWIDEEWGFAYENRIFAPPMLSLLDLEQAVAELDWAIGRGAKVVHLQAGPVDGRSPADPYFDPFWAQVNEAALGVAFHSGHSGYQRYSGEWSEDPDAPFDGATAFQWIFYWCDRPIMETLCALIMHNLFGRFPNIRVASVENGAVWVPYIVRKMDHSIRMGKQGTFGKLETLPSEIFRQHVLVTPNPEEKLSRLLEVVGTDSVVFGSDFPHAEGLPEPGLFVETRLKDMEPADIDIIMRKNMARFVGVDLG